MIINRETKPEVAAIGLLSGSGLVAIMWMCGLLDGYSASAFEVVLIACNALTLYSGSQHWAELSFWMEERNRHKKLQRKAARDLREHAEKMAHLRGCATEITPWVVEFWCDPDDYYPGRWLLHGQHQRGMNMPLTLIDALNMARSAKDGRDAIVPWRVRDLLTGREVVC